MRAGGNKHWGGGAAFCKIRDQKWRNPPETTHDTDRYRYEISFTFTVNPLVEAHDTKQIHNFDFVTFSSVGFIIRYLCSNVLLFP